MEELRRYIASNFYFLKSEQVEKLTNELSKFCIQNNISNLKVLGNGESSITFEFNNEIIKLTFMEYDNHKSLKEYVSHSKHILQPDSEQIIELGGYNAKILKTKKLQPLTIEETSVALIDMYCYLRDDGYLWYDIKPENVGKDENGNYYLFDYGELIYIDDLPEYKRNQELDSHYAKKPQHCAFYDDRIEKRDIKNNNRTSDRCYTQEEIMQDPKYFAQKFSEGNKDLEELLLFCYSNGVSTWACCAGHENSETRIPRANIVFNVQKDQYAMFSLLIDLLLKSNFIDVAEIEVRNPTGNQVIFDVALNDLKYKKEFFNGIRLSLQQGLFYDDENKYTQLFEIFDTISRQAEEDNSVSLQIGKEKTQMTFLGVQYVESIDETTIATKDLCDDNSALISYLSSLESSEDIDLNNISNSYLLSDDDINNIYNMDIINSNKNVK